MQAWLHGIIDANATTSTVDNRPIQSLLEGWRSGLHRISLPNVPHYSASGEALPAFFSRSSGQNFTVGLVENGKNPRNVSSVSACAQARAKGVFMAVFPIIIVNQSSIPCVQIWKGVMVRRKFAKVSRQITVFQANIRRRQQRRKYLKILKIRRGAEAKVKASL